jgi:hypothetical protein
MGKLLISHRSTIYPCFIPDLGELTGAGRIRLTRHKSIKLPSYPATIRFKLLEEPFSGACKAFGSRDQRKKPETPPGTGSFILLAIFAIVL